MTTSGVAASPPSRGDMIVYRLCRSIAVGVSRLYFPGTVKGRENLPPQGAYIVAPVHRSYVDWLIVARITARRRLRYIVKEEVWKSKLIGHVIEAYGGFPVNRSGADREALQRCQAVLSGGEPLVMFPKGTRRSGPQVQELKDGWPTCSFAPGCPWFPWASAARAAPCREGRLFPPRHVNIVIGPPVPALRTADGDATAAVGQSEDPVVSARRARIGREAVTEQSLRVSRGNPAGLRRRQGSLRH